MTIIDEPHPEHPIVLPPDLPSTPVIVALLQLVDCVCEYLVTEGAGPTCWCGLYPGGQVSWEYCGECRGDTCGMGYVRLTRIFPYNTFPVGTIDFHCTSPLAWGIEVGALRCFPQPEDGGILAPPEMNEIAIKQYLDGRAIHSAIKCCGLTTALETYIPVGPQGGCVGGFWMAYLDDPR